LAQASAAIIAIVHTIELADANPPCGSELFASRALWGANFCGPWPLPSAGGKRAQIARLHANIDGPGITATPVAIPVDLDGVQVQYFSCPVLRRLIGRRRSAKRSVTRSANSI
jgi:hypothetical protein